MKTLIQIIAGIFVLLLFSGCSDFQKAKHAGTAAAYREFLKTNPDSKYSAKAYEAYIAALAREGTGNFKDQISLDQAINILRTRKLDKGTETQISIQFLKQVVNSQGEDERYIITSISAVPEMKKVESADRFCKSIKGVVASSLDSTADRRINGHSVVLDGDNQYWLVSADGQFSIESTGAWLRGVSGDVMIRSGSDRTEICSQLTNEKVLLGFQWMGTLQPVIPAAEGSVIRLSGEIKDFAGGWMFSGDPQDPLVFMFTDKGLIYLAGTGRITTPSGAESTLPDAALGLRPGGNGFKIIESAELPSVDKIRVDPGVMSIDNEKTLLWYRDIEKDLAGEVFTLDTGLTKEIGGRTWVAVDEGRKALKEANDVISENNRIWIWDESLKCSDAWERYWDTNAGRSWYRQVDDQSIINKRLYKEKEKEFTRNYKDDTWSGPDAEVKSTADHAEIRLSDDGNNFLFVGKLAYGLGELRPPLNGFFAALLKNDPKPILRKGGVPEKGDAFGQLVSLGKAVKPKAGSMTIEEFLDETKKYPKACSLLADRQKNYVQSIAEVMDSSAGQKVLGFGLGGKRGDRFNTGSEYFFTLTEQTAYPLSRELAVWSGRLKVIPDPDGLPMKWCVDGTNNRLKQLRRTLINGKPVGAIEYLFTGTYKDGHPQEVVIIHRKGAHEAGPIAREEIFFHEGMSAGSIPKNERMLFTPFGKDIIIDSVKEVLSSASPPVKEISLDEKKQK